MMSGKQRAGLKRLAAGLSPVFQVGKGGVEDNLIKATDNCLAARELIKLRVLETSPQPPDQTARALARATHSQVVHVMGRTLVLFRQKPKDSQFSELFP